MTVISCFLNISQETSVKQMGSAGQNRLQAEVYKAFSKPATELNYVYVLDRQVLDRGGGL